MNRYKKSFIIFLSLVIILSIIGCSAKKDHSLVEDSFPSESKSDSSPGSDFDDVEDLKPKKIITTFHFDLETTEFEISTDRLEDLITKYNGYVENSNISYNSYYGSIRYRRGDYTIRIPKSKGLDFKAELNSLGNITRENTNREDVTKQYRDMDSRLRIITTKEERILSLLEKAEKIEDIIALENQLHEIIYEKENLKSNLMNLDDKIEYTTVYLYLQEVEKLSTQENIDTGFGTRIKNAFGESLYMFKNTLQNLVIGGIYLLPFILVLGILLVALYLIFRKFRNKKD